jgi:hypothetical protein
MAARAWPTAFSACAIALSARRVAASATPAAEAERRATASARAIDIPGDPRIQGWQGGHPMLTVLAMQLFARVTVTDSTAHIPAPASYIAANCDDDRRHLEGHLPVRSCAPIPSSTSLGPTRLSYEPGQALDALRELVAPPA